MTEPLDPRDVDPETYVTDDGQEVTNLLTAPRSLLTWHMTSGGTHVGSRNGAGIVRIFEVNHGMSREYPALFVVNWDAPTPPGWWSDSEPHEWRGTEGTVEERDRLLAEAKASQERTFRRWLGLMGFLPIEMPAEVGVS